MNVPDRCGCANQVMGRENEKWCHNDISNAPGWVTARDRISKEVCQHTGIDAERITLKVTTGCFNRPKRAEVLVEGSTDEEKHQIEGACRDLFHDPPDPGYFEKLRMLAWFSVVFT